MRVRSEAGDVDEEGAEGGDEMGCACADGDGLGGRVGKGGRFEVQVRRFGDVSSSGD